MASLRRLVVAGATGKQGGALISALLAKSSQPFEIYAITRNKDSRGAQSLASKPNVRVIEGNFDKPEAIFRQIPNAWGLFSVTMPMNARTEEREGKAMTKAALDSGVKHIVFTATDRGGDKSDTDPTYVPHFASKYHIERDIMEKARASGATWTFLRPVAFMENITDSFLGRLFMTAWRQNGLNSNLQLISSKDIGRVAAEAFLNADSEEYRNKALSLAGDDLSSEEAAAVFKEVTGQEMRTTFGFFSTTAKWVLWEQLGVMLKWFKTVGCKADVKALRQRYPFMMDFRSWLVEESDWRASMKS